MKLLEYEAKQLLSGYGLATPAGRLIRHGDTEGGSGGGPAVVKAQVPVGGRGKAGGIRTVHSEGEMAAARAELLGRPLLGHEVRSVLVEELLEPERELYMAVVLDRTEQALVLLAHHSGGVEINGAVRERGPALKLVLQAEPTRAMARRTLEYLALPESHLDALYEVMTGLWRLCTSEEAALVEINPLMVTGGRLVCADAKIELDDAAGFRHTGRTFEAAPASAQFVVLEAEGSVASLANGAGLAMATNDAIAAAGEVPANFFDVGGGTNAADMTAGFARIRALPQVRAIVVNIFGGITRCDEVAEAIIAAQASADGTPPLFIRLAGTNAREGAALLEAAGIATLPSLGHCVEAAVLEARRA